MTAPELTWVTSWIGSVQGPYPVGNPSAQPLMTDVFPQPAQGARDQSFRLMVRPDLWGPQTRIRLSNALGTQTVTFADVYVGVQQGSSAVLKGTNRPVTVGGQRRIRVPPGQSIWSDPVDLPFVRPDTLPWLQGRRLAVSFHVPDPSGPMTWHAKALTTSYLTAPGTGSQGHREEESAFNYTTTSWFFLDAVDMMAPADTRVVVGFGDSITDGTASTLNGDDRWPDVLSRRLQREVGQPVVVLNAGIGGNQVVGPSQYSPTQPFPGGPSALMRLERDILSLSGVTTVIWLEGINDFGKNGNASAEAVIEGMRAGVARMRQHNPSIRVLGATVVSALGSTSEAHGFGEQDEKRKVLNEFIRTSGVFDGVVEFDPAILDPDTGGMRPPFVHDTTVGGPGDKLHPNRLGYQAMGLSIDLRVLLGR
ncbi:MAG: GDSL-type esterase/lipase family protein [Limnohabitans sp.]